MRKIGSQKTISDVAKMAEVSITTVSRVINNNYPVNTKTRQKVEAAIKALDFTPNSLARGLIQKKTYTIGVIVPSITNLFFPAVVNGIQDYCRTHDYNILLCDTEGKASAEVRHVKALIEKRVDGIIAVDPRTENLKNGFYEKISETASLVIINGYNDNVNCNFVLSNQEAGTVEALEYLIKSGHTDIAFLRGHPSYSYDLKENIYKEVLNAHGIPVKIENILMVENGNSIQTVELSVDTALKRLSGANRPTAIFACNDWMAVGVLHAAQKLYIDVPAELSVIGFDNILISEMIMPKLTTVDQGMHRLGEISAKTLFETMEEKTEPRKLYVETKLVLRQSTKSI